MEIQNIMHRKLILKGWSISVGSMDALTGLLLILQPRLVLKLLDIREISTGSCVFLSWIGVFVFAVGLSYGFALGGRERGEFVWIYTALTRMLVAIFLTVHILDGSLSRAWGWVALSDASVAGVQWAILRAKWWKEVAK
jgi:hypothetical protein